MLRIRLRRIGKKGNPSYRIVVADSAAPRDGKYLEWIGNYDPMKDPPAVALNEDRAARWLGQGAQPSDAVRRILDKAGVLERAPAFGTATGSATVETAPSSATMVRADSPGEGDPDASAETAETEPQTPEEDEGETAEE
jgi:small subunit ribosomal protein S16